MRDVIITISFLAMCISGAGLLAIFSMDLAVYFYKRSSIVRKYEQAKQLEMIRAVINNVLSEIKTLTADELALLRYVYDTQRSAVYIPVNDSAGLTLWRKGYLRQVVSNYFPRVHGKGGRFTTACYLFELQNNLRPLIKSHYDVIDWKNSPAPDYDKYQ